MKLTIIFSAICTFLGGVYASFLDVEESNVYCATIAKICSDLDNASAYFSHLKSSDRVTPPTQLALELIEGLDHMQFFMKDVSSMDLTSYPQLKPLKLIIPAIQNGLQDQAATLEKQLARGEVDDGIRSRIDSISKGLAQATSKLNDGNWAAPCDLNEHVKLGFLTSYFCSLAIALQIFIGVLNLFNLLSSVIAVLQLICILRP
ncbi:hypothetical protein N7478_012211 [Penicillium angulare]|uniref:uncharacterized protein n=1 Tax=Penicillium angulare TaxID=116970 RepID=UPI0025416584|nr:uncharacterized protein N7478_012211 [Penicillium angulare]KAJ5259230.1 hypothetical protein N7478_012211 [Penicillium angulare]